MPADQPVLDLRSVYKSFGSSCALDGVDLSIDSRTTTVLIGPSGCGKSTLLRTIIGLSLPDRGMMRFEGEPITRSSLPGLRRRMGYVIQEGGLFPHLSARDNVTLMARHIGWHATRIEARIAELGELTRLPIDLLQRYPIQLSGGQRQRVSLMRALMLDPQVLLLDEPLGALDPMIRAVLQDDLRAIFRRLGTTVILVTHDLGEAAFFGDRIVLMRDGRIVQQGSIDDLLGAPAEPFVAEFVNAQRRAAVLAGAA